MLYALAAIVLLGPVVWGLRKVLGRQRIRRDVLNEIEAKNSGRVISSLRRNLDRARSRGRRVRKRKGRPNA